MNKMLWACFAAALVSASACNDTEERVSAAIPAASEISASNEKSEQQVIQVVTDWINGVPKRDAEHIGQLLANDFVAILWDGTTRTRAQYLDELRSGKYVVEDIALEEPHARILGDVAVVTYYQFEKSKSAGQNSSGGSAWTDVLARRDGRWQVVAEHGSRFD